MNFFAEIQNKKRLTVEEWNMVAKLVQSGTPEERDKAALVLKMRVAVPIVASVLRERRISDTVFEANYHTPDTYRDDLINEAWTTAFLRTKEFDPERGVSLQSYLYKYVRGAVKRLFERTVSSIKPHYVQDKENKKKHHVVVTYTKSLSDKVKIKNKESKKTLEDTIENPMEELQQIAHSSSDNLVRLISYAQKELTPPLFHMFVIFLRGERSIIEISKLDVMSRQRFYTLLRKIKRDFSLKGGGTNE